MLFRSTNKSITVNEDGTVNGKISGTDVDGDTLTFTVNSKAAHGSVTVDSKTGAYTYIPTANYNGSDTFTVDVTDGTATVTSTISVTVQSVNDEPIAAADSYTVSEDGTLTTTALNGVLVNDSDPNDTIDTDSISAVLVSGPAHGSLSLNSDGTFTYTPTANFNGTDSFRDRKSRRLNSSH